MATDKTAGERRENDEPGELDQWEDASSFVAVNMVLSEAESTEEEDNTKEVREKAKNLVDKNTTRRAIRNDGERQHVTANSDGNYNSWTDPRYFVAVRMDSNSDFVENGSLVQGQRGSAIAMSVGTRQAASAATTAIADVKDVHSPRLQPQQPILPHQLQQPEQCFKCNVCSEVLETKAAYDSHVKIHTEQIPCNICGLLLFVSNLEKHMELHTRSPIHVCKVCNTGFHSIEQLVTHIRTHSSICPNDRPYSCQLCDTAFQKIEALRAHVRQHRETEKPYVCLACGSLFVNSLELKAHSTVCKQQNENTPAFICESCGKSFKEKDPYISHLRDHQNEKPHKCDICEAAFSRKRYLTKHMRTHAGKRRYDCHICSSSFYQEIQLNMHMEAHHLSDRPYVCNNCNEAFAESGQLEDHIEMHRRKERSTLRCPVCTLPFLQKVAFDRHIRKHFQEEEEKVRGVSLWN